MGVNISQHQFTPQWNFGEVTAQAIRQQRDNAHRKQINDDNLQMENKLIDLVKKPLADATIRDQQIRQDQWEQAKANDEFAKKHILSKMDRRETNWELEQELSDLENQFWRPKEFSFFNPVSWFVDSEEHQKEDLRREYREQYSDQYDPRNLLSKYDPDSNVSAAMYNQLFNDWTQIDTMTNPMELNEMLDNIR